MSSITQKKEEDLLARGIKRRETITPSPKSKKGWVVGREWSTAARKPGKMRDSKNLLGLELLWA